MVIDTVALREGMDFSTRWAKRGRGGEGGGWRWGGVGGCGWVGRGVGCAWPAAPGVHFCVAAIAPPCRCPPPFSAYAAWTRAPSIIQTMWAEAP